MSGDVRTETSGAQVYHSAVAGSIDSRTLVTISTSGCVAAFATAAQAPKGLDSAQLAARAGNWAAQVLGRESAVLYAEQRHTTIIYSFAPHQPLQAEPRCVGVCDGLLTAERGVTLTVRTADCLPVVLTGGGVVAILHGGWRPLAGDIVGKCVRRFAWEYGVEPHALHAVLGVGIGACHYPVGPEVIAALTQVGVPREEFCRDGRVDLAKWVGVRLQQVGVQAGSIRTIPGCTACSPEYHSFRRDGPQAGRQWSAVVLT